ncbi:hypothetical protein MLB55_001808 [Salmonella enterica]|uniref:Uncharacterized protein n=1 Tax=Salmonella newport TaxID=108619 RepID=A0A5Y0S7R4_SALNE|nr:hypothetical protein [Salmonella enterica]EBS4088847.1 hypothetical protein [Salmonella enterica subsp. enterica serovar Newport]EBS4408720.1 hypothetical protein [Salmonella enterica subsp. enterica serovar Newport]EBV0464759.1 hypothetical protein [Salmonella enterica subsp. enterica serovar Newport]EBX1212440.1 hypothetical protein [Salmonella enterica subsp. enterica serovar Newport]
MKRYTTALLFCTLSFAGQLAHADVIDDAIGNIQQAINDAYHAYSALFDHGLAQTLIDSDAILQVILF